MKKNHDRSPDKKGFSVALPKSLVERLSKIAESEHRSRNGQIELFLERAVKEWAALSEVKKGGLTQSASLDTTPDQPSERKKSATGQSRKS